MTETICDHCKKPVPSNEVWGLAAILNGKPVPNGKWDLHKVCYDKIKEKIEKP